MYIREQNYDEVMYYSVSKIVVTTVPSEKCLCSIPMKNCGWTKIIPDSVWNISIPQVQTSLLHNKFQSFPFFLAVDIQMSPFPFEVIVGS